MTMDKKSPQVGYLLHLTHYDPGWNKRKDAETPFDPDVGRAVVDALAIERVGQPAAVAQRRQLVER